MHLLAFALLLAPQEPPHLQLARDLVSRIAHAQMNVYGGGPRQIDWSVDHPSARTVCSSFQTLLLMRSYNLSEADIKAWFGKKNPKAEDYYDAILAGKHFTRITKYGDIKPGDLIAIKYTDGHISKDGNEDSGHVMLVDSVQRPFPNGPHYGGPPFARFVLTVIDSTSSGHGVNDTRHVGKGKFSGGIGRGQFELWFDDKDGIAGYSWSDSASSLFYGSWQRLIAVGRIRL